jgi:hypothetical protein
MGGGGQERSPLPCSPPPQADASSAPFGFFRSAPMPKTRCRKRAAVSPAILGHRIEPYAAPPQSCAVATSCHRARAPLRQTLAVAPQRSAALQQRSLDRPWHTSRAEIVRLRGVPINRGAGERGFRHRSPPPEGSLPPPTPLRLKSVGSGVPPPPQHLGRFSSREGKARLRAHPQRIETGSSGHGRRRKRHPGGTPDPTDFSRNGVGGHAVPLLARIGVHPAH